MHLQCEARAALAGVAMAFNGPISGMAFIAEESAANLGGPVYYRALISNCVGLLVFNILVAAYNDQGYFWNSRCDAAGVECPSVLQAIDQ